MNEKKKFMKKNDFILAIVVLVVAVVLYLLHSMLNGAEAATVTIKVDGEMKGTYSLLEEQEIEINNGSNILLIKDGKADMIEADCPDLLCVKQRAISKNHENIICLPNKVVVEVQSSEESELDAVTN